MKELTRTKMIVSLKAVDHNFEEMRKKIPENTKMVAVLKADGYGHGGVKIAQHIHDYEYIWGIAVAVSEEAMEMRAGGITKPILILGHVFPEDYKELIQADVRMTVSELWMAEKINEVAAELGKKAIIHIGLNTGMNRIGVQPDENGVAIVKAISLLEHVEIEGLFSHFARADEYDVQPAYDQFERYTNFRKRLEEEQIQITYYHTSNSAGIMRVPESHMDLVRAGITIYGIYPSDEVETEKLPIESILEWKASVSYVKEIHAGDAISYGGTYVAPDTRKIATIPVGYADGYPRSLSNKGCVLIHGKRAPITGRVCMDQFMVDVTDIPDVKPMDEVTLIGKDGDEHITTQEMGDLSGRFPYELVCDLGKRIPRVYID